MSLVKTWCTVMEAVSKFGVPEERIMEWVDEGVVRSELDGTKVARVNCDDLELLVAERVALR